MMPTDAFEPEQLQRLAQYRMPFGKYKGKLLYELPEPYLIWYVNKGFPKGELGNMMGLVYEIKLNGLEYLLKPLTHKMP